MQKLTIQRVIDLLPTIQKGRWVGEIKILSENLPIPARVRKTLDIHSSKMLFVYMGVDVLYCETPAYLAFIENEGGAILTFPYTLDKIPENYKPVVSEMGMIGFALEEKVETEVIITWENKKPQAKVVETGEILELNKIPNEPIMRTKYQFLEKKNFGIEVLLFGHSNILGYYPDGMECCVNLVNAENWQNSKPFDSRAYLRNISEIRTKILQAGENVTYEELQTIFDEEREAKTS